MAALQSLPQPTTVSEIQHMNGGINTIVEHIPGLQFLLAPFYATTSKERLTRADNAELRQPWADLKQALLNAQYYWRKVCVVYEAVKYFYPYLDGCVNLRIETDCRMVVSLFVHKVDNDADQLAQFKLALTSMDIKKVMLVHRPGIKQETTDWLLRAKERLWPHKAPKGKADIEISGKGVIYTISVLYELVNATYTVMQANLVGNTPAAIFFGPDTVQPGKAFTIWVTDSAKQTEQASHQHIGQQVL
ncbi:hypothetical protein IW147_002244 [Coemansia sp. RSA 720]|nr:hypothetical protein IW147_002244 [Coemansia sp. RSA 720]